MGRRVSVEIISLLFIILFVYAAVNKLMDVEKFRVQIGQSPLLTPYSDWVAIAIPVMEVAIAVMLSVQRFRLIGLYSAFTLMVMFTAYIFAILNFSTYIPCSCGGVLERLGWTEHLVFNIVFVLLAVAGIVFQARARMGRDNMQQCTTV